MDISMDEAIKAGDGTLHGAIDYWQTEAARLRAEAEALREDASKIPDILFDGWSVLQALDGPAKKRTSPENVSDVLDAVVNILKAAAIRARGGEK